MTDVGPIELGHGASVSAVAFDRLVLPDGATCTVVNKTNALKRSRWRADGAKQRMHFNSVCVVMALMPACTANHRHQQHFLQAPEPSTCRLHTRPVLPQQRNNRSFRVVTVGCIVHLVLINACFFGSSPKVPDTHPQELRRHVVVC
jgi:hypothetical protein